MQVNYYILMCYPISSSPFYWKILILAYLAVYQIVGIVLAFETRKVKFPGLRDSAFAATMIYISSLVFVMLAVDIFILSSYLNSHGAIFAIGILILTTIFLIFTFVPKVVYKLFIEIATHFVNVFINFYVIRWCYFARVQS